MFMNRIFQSSAEAFLFRLSDQAEHYKTDLGIYKVTSPNHPQKVFPNLLEAFLFYIGLDEEADLWDISTGSVLIERKVKMYLN